MNYLLYILQSLLFVDLSEGFDNPKKLFRVVGISNSKCNKIPKMTRIARISEKDTILKYENSLYL